MAVKLRALFMLAATLQMVASAPSGSPTSNESSTPRLLFPIDGSESGKTSPHSPVHSWPTRPNTPPSPDYKNDPKFNLMLQGSDSDREHWSDEEQRQAHAKQIRGESLAGPLSPTSASKARNSIMALHLAKDPEHAHERAMREYAALDDAEKGRRLESWLAQSDCPQAAGLPVGSLAPQTRIIGVLARAEQRSSSGPEANWHLDPYAPATRSEFHSRGESCIRPSPALARL
ncbi:hypothetical protein IE81DRAFT_35341 [Ceraceosorus guamensis]|uniref:SCP domain-containing protein n=1 Tax=Ceraceosorus guamensis TaxID=1522189 RepID=A0A316VPT2_9BASI|nr:hypothetical protein IE81DRAFT_35341 [Ceraceosorus guamensis]PWN39294.1 hypothetical protein IE81DRAFT_35341 [Ceraceosorus guamensis]